MRRKASDRFGSIACVIIPVILMCISEDKLEF
jgi:hypothetical protein